ncbi:MAG: V-type ATP synthase subunit D [Candidatus Limnocylindrales bacterium]
MPLHVPPGRAGRLWLRERLVVAERAADVLEQKRRVLLAQSVRLRRVADETRGTWDDACRLAETWHLRVALLGGEDQVHAAAAYLAGPAEARIAWRSTMGLAYPADAECLLSDEIRVGGIADTAALQYAIDAHRAALLAAVAHGAAQRAADLVTSELEATTRRLRAIERRWIPRLETALREVRRRLDEREREEAVRARWAHERLEAAGREPSLG